MSVWNAKSAPKIAGEIHRIWWNKSQSTIQKTIKTWWPTFIEGHVDVVMDNVAMTREHPLLKYSTMSKQWTSSYSRSKSPSVAETTTVATASRSDLHDVTDSWWQYAYCIYCYWHWPNRFTIGIGRGINRPVLENSCKIIMGLVMCTW